MNLRVLGVIAAAAFVLGGCTTTNQLSGAGFRPPEGAYKVIVLDPDISVGILTAGGAVEPHEEWTNQARENVLTALRAQQASRGGEITIVGSADETGLDRAQMADLADLHTAVGTSIKLHKYMGLPLPTKKDRFDWSLGAPAVSLGTTSGHDYALFLHAEDSFSSGGRVALQVAGMLSCGLGVCVMPPGGQQVAFASLVDLKTGEVVWFNFLLSGVGDIRSPEGAGKMVDGLLDDMKPAAEKKTSKRT